MDIHPARVVARNVASHLAKFQRYASHLSIMKFLIQTVFLLIICVASVSAQQKSSPRFEDYKVPRYKGKIHLPKWIRRVKSDEWRDELNKFFSSEPPEVNFAGKYFLARHGCGTECTYYTLTDLSTGRDLDRLGIFGNGDPPLKTRDGRDISILLDYNRDSKMLIAQYSIDFGQEKSRCRERVFLFENEKLKSITNIRNECRRLNESN